MPRRVGLSRQQKPQPLLKQVGGHFAQPKLRKLPPNIDDPPISSDEEDGSEAGGHDRIETAPAKVTVRRSASSALQPSDSSEDEAPTRGSIQPTTFSSKQANKHRKADGEVEEKARSKRDLASHGPSIKRRRLSSERIKTDTTSSSQTAPTSSGEHLQDERGFTKAKRSKVTYKKRVPNSQELPSAPEESAAGTNKLRVPDGLRSPTKSKSSTLSIPDKGITSPPTKHAVFRIPGENTRGLDPTPQEFETGFKSVDTGIPVRNRARKNTTRTKKGKEELKESPSPPRAVFKMPTAITELDLVGTGTFRTKKGSHSVTGSDDGLRTDDDLAISGLFTSEQGCSKPSAATCPWCGETVERRLLDEFAGGKRLNVRMQTRFCQRHKKKTALETWQLKRYPQVEWPTLERRFAQHRQHLLHVVNDSEPSYFRSILARNVEAGKARSTKKEGNLNPGYYGPRGFNVMSDYLVKEFGNILKQRAVDDRVISGRGSAAFIQSVLVAELAVRLIMEDMDVSAEEARDIMEESKALGEMVHEEES